MRTLCNQVLLMSVFLPFPVAGFSGPPEEKEKQATPEQVVRKAVRKLLKEQEEDGVWRYECTCQDTGQGPPHGYRVGSTSIVATALLFAAPDDKEVRTAVQRALAYVLDELDDPAMAANTENQYDVRVWGQGFALEFLCLTRAHQIAGKHAKKVNEWIPRLVQVLIEEQFPGGGWHYARFTGAAATFVTAPITQALLLARSQGEKVSDEVFGQICRLLKRLRTEEGGFNYDGRGTSEDEETPSSNPDNSLPGSGGRALVCETTLFLLGGGSIDAVRAGLDNFHKHWDELENRRQQPGAHEGEYNIAPYYFYFGHRYAAQAIQALPEKERAKERKRLLKLILQTRNEDGDSWNDCVFELARNYGTAMMVLALLGDQAPPLPPKWTKKK